MRGKPLFTALVALITPHTDFGQGTGARASEAPAPRTCAIEPHALVSDACVSFETLETLNKAVVPSLQDVTHSTDFFAYYRLNLYNRKCPYWGDEHALCGNIACAVSTLDDEKDIPPIWRAEELSKLEGPRAQHPGRQQQKDRGQKPLQGILGEDVDEDCVVEYDDECDDRDYCVPEDESATAKGDYVSLVDNPERFTGYAGKDPQMVWDAIYKENCFSKPSTPPSSSSPGTGGPLNMFQAAKDLRSVMQSRSTEPLLDDSCIEKRVFYRLISGMHASISMHICHDYLNQKTGTWGPNVTCYEDRFLGRSEYLANLYFNYALVLRAVAKLEPYLKTYRFCAGDAAENTATQSKVAKLAATAASTPMVFDESVMFQDPASGIELKEDFRNRFRNVSRLMDCVGCDKCRLWGKLQTAGYGTALKILFEFDDGEDFSLKRTELVALVNTFARISHSISSAAHFRSRLDGIGKDDPALRSSERHMSNILAKEDGEEDDGFDDYLACGTPFLSEEGPSVMESFWSEFGLIYRTTRFILAEWARLPRKLGQWVIWELDRVWRFWLGLPVPDIVYEWVKPARRDEL